jgi:hypothetical protein
MIRQLTLLFIVFAAWLWQSFLTQKTSKAAALGDLHLLGQPALSEQQIVAFLSKNNPDLPKHYVEEIAKIYHTESKSESINPAIAVAQMTLETGFLRFGGSVRKEQNNFAGLGCVNVTEKGIHFKTPREGIRAHIQHLKAYASRTQLGNSCVDPRRKFVEKSENFGKLETVYDLTGVWAMDKDYGEKLAKLTFELLQTKENT